PRPPLPRLPRPRRRHLRSRRRRPPRPRPRAVRRHSQPARHRMSSARTMITLALLAACRAPAGPTTPALDPRECTPDAARREAGLWPAAGTTLKGKVGAPFRAVLTYVAPADVAGVELQVAGPLPPGLLITCGSEGCRVAAGARG